MNSCSPQENSLLLVDDEQNVLNALKRELGRDYNITTACSAQDALAILSDQPVQVVISDYKMPVMNGVEFLKEVRSRWPNTVRIILSGFAETSALVNAINDGHIYRFINKPWNYDELRIAINNALEHYALEMHNIQLTEELRSKNDELMDLNKHLEEMVAERTSRLMEAQKKLIYSEKLATIGMLSAGVAHEVKNPLAIIVQGSEILENALKDRESLQQIVTEIKKAALRGDRIVRGLMDFARQTPAKLEDADIRDIVETALNVVEHQFSLKGISIKREYPCDAVRLMLDKQQIEQVFLNLLLNAADAMPDGGTINIVIDTYRAEDEIRWLRISFTDSGKGVPPGELKRIFDPFYTTKQKSGGTGLGLSVSLGIIENHGGSIQAESTEGKGTCFIINLPCQN